MLTNTIMNINNGEKTILIFVEPGPLQGSIQAFVASMTQIKNILLADDEQSTLKMLRKSEIHLLIIDMNNSKDKVLELLRKIKSENFPTQCLVLVDDANSIAAAENVGASACILKGFAVQQMATTIQQILNNHLPT